MHSASTKVQDPEPTNAAYRASLPARRLAVAFDFDGTLTTTDPTKFLILALLSCRPQKALAAARGILHLASHKLTPQAFKAIVISKLVSGANQAVVERATKRYANIVHRFFRPTMVYRLKTHESGIDEGVFIGRFPAAVSFDDDDRDF